jgi:hypothetical protein
VFFLRSDRCTPDLAALLFQAHKSAQSNARVGMVCRHWKCDMTGGNSPRLSARVMQPQRKVLLLGTNKTSIWFHKSLIWVALKMWTVKI